MPLDFQNVPVSFDKGLDTKTDSKQLIVGKMLAMQNCSFKSLKEISKRDGFSQISPSLPKGVGISGYQNELAALDGSNLYSYSPNTSQQIVKGALVPVDLSVSSVVRNIHNQSGPDSAFHPGTGLRCFVWIDSGSGGINYSVADSTTGSYIVANKVVVSTGVKAKVLTLGQYFIIIYYDSSGTSLKYKVINTATPTSLGSAVTIASDILSTVQAFDSAIINGSAYIAYGKSATQIAFYSVSSGLVLSSQYVVATGNTPNPAITVIGDASNNVWCAYGTFSFPGSVYGLVVNSALNSTLLAPVSIDSINTKNITMTVSGTQASVYYEVDSTSPYIKSNTLTLSGTAGSAATVMRGVGLASKCLTHNFIDYFLAIYAGPQIPNSVSSTVATTIQPTYFLINSVGLIVMKLAPLSAGLYCRTALLPEMISQSSNQFTFPYLFQDSVTSSGGAILSQTGVNQASINFAIANAMGKLNLSSNLHLASGQLWMYDGASVVEHGFHIYPENLSDSVTNSGGGIGVGTSTASINQVEYVAIYRWVDNQGNTHVSAPSPALAVQLTPPAQVTAKTFTATSTQFSTVLTSVSSFTGLFVGQTITGTGIPAGTTITNINQASSQITMSNAATGSTAGLTLSTKDVLSISVTIPTLRQTIKTNVVIDLYRTQNNQTTFYLTSSVTSPQANDTTVDTITIVDTTPDPVLSGNRQLYTTGGTVPNIAAPAISAIATFKSRAVYLSPENPFQFGYSQQVIDGTPVEFNSLEFVQNIDQRIGQATALAPLDDKIILFGPKRKFYTVGSGPSPNGTNDDFTDPAPIAGVTGCSNPNSVLELPIGLIYQDATKGFWLLDRSLQEHYIGADVEAFNSQTVTSANLIPNSTRAIFTLSSGTNLIYDYFVEQWETDVFPSAAADSTLFQDDFVYIQANGLILKQTPGSFSDNGAVVPIGFTTGWISFASINGFQRVKELQITETYKSPHTLTVNIYTDYSATPSQTVTIPVLSQPSPPMFRIGLKIQKCTAIQVQVLESQTGSPGEGLSLSSLAFRVGAKKGLEKLQAGQSY